MERAVEHRPDVVREPEGDVIHATVHLVHAHVESVEVFSFLGRAGGVEVEVLVVDAACCREDVSRLRGHRACRIRAGRHSLGGGAAVKIQVVVQLACTFASITASAMRV